MSCFRKPKVARTDVDARSDQDYIAIEQMQKSEQDFFKADKRTVETISACENSEADYLLAPLENPNTKTIVFDLDETLISSTFDQNSKAQFQLKLRITPKTADLQQDFSLDHIPVFIVLRNGAAQMLKKLAKYYELILWTASTQEYADAVLKETQLDRYFQHKFYREDCTVSDKGLPVKDLARLNRNLRNLVLVDDTECGIEEQCGSTILIQKFTGQQDTLLPRLEQMLVEISSAAELRGSFHSRWFEAEM